MKLRMRLEPWKLQTRKNIVENPFGTLKRAFNQGYLLLKGLRKTAGEVEFTMLAYNMRKVYVWPEFPWFQESRLDSALSFRIFLRNAKDRLHHQ